MEEPHAELFAALELRRLELVTYLHGHHHVDVDYLKLLDQLDDMTRALHTGDQVEARRILNG